MDLLERIVLEMNTKPVEVVAAGKVAKFSLHYAKNRDKILKAFAWICRGEEVKLEGDYFEIGFSDFSEDYQERISPFNILVPYSILGEMGYGVGEKVEDLTIFLEPTEDKINAYLAKPHSRQLSKKQQIEICREVDESLKDYDKD